MLSVEFPRLYMPTTFFSVIALANTIYRGILNSSSPRAWQGLLCHLKLFSLCISTIASSKVTTTLQKSQQHWDVTPTHHSCTQFIGFLHTCFQHQISMPGCVLTETTIWKSPGITYTSHIEAFKKEDKVHHQLLSMMAPGSRVNIYKHFFLKLRILLHKKQSSRSIKF